MNNYERARIFIYNIMLLKICLKVLVTIQLTMYMLFLYVTEFLAESNEGNYFFIRSRYSGSWPLKRNGLEELSTEILGMEAVY